MILPEPSTMIPSQQRSIIPCDQALRVGRVDAEQTYRDLSHYRITIQLEEDGWHIDYDLPKAGWAGGGPHYVIDATTGTILEKRHEQ
jgi:hypothetical protein